MTVKRKPVKIQDMPRLERMRQMRADGFSDAAIGQSIGISRMRVYRLLGKAGTDRRKGARIAAGPASTPLATALKAWRLRNGLTQKQASQILGLSTVTVYSRWEGGGPCLMNRLIMRFIGMYDFCKQHGYDGLTNIN